MEPWREHLSVSFAKLNGDTKKAANKIFKVLEGTLSNKECDRCFLKCYEADVLQLECGHILCFDCVADQLERLVGFFERNQSGLAEQLYLVIKQLLICSTCHRLFVVRRRSVFHVTMQSKDRGWLNRDTYEVDAAASSIVSGKHNVWARFDNERRTLFGCFSPDSLFSCERPAHTRAESDDTMAGTVPFDYADVSEKLTQENSLWLEDWKHDKTMGNQQGWHYALNWPAVGNCFRWRLEPNVWGTFVRRRRMLRVSVRLEALLALRRHITGADATLELVVESPPATLPLKES